MFEATSHCSSASQTGAEPKELLVVLSILNEKQNKKHKQQAEGEMQQHQQYQHLHYHHQHHGLQQHRQQQLEECKWEHEQKQSQQQMELSQIELIYRAEGNANLVLALPQFKKVLRLPKMSTQHRQEHVDLKAQDKEIQRFQNNSLHHKQLQGQLNQQDEMNQQELNKISTAGQQENKNDAVGILTMDHYVAYISIIRCLVGNEFVFEADIVAVPNPTDSHWINEHIKPYRPANRLDKEFGGHFGLLLPDATQLPAEFDILFSNLQCKGPSATTTATTATKTTYYSSSSNNSSNTTDNTCSISNNIFGPDTFAIEIKPKQGWLLPNDVNNLFDKRPKTTQPTSLPETKTALKSAVAATKAKASKSSTDSEWFTATQNDPSQTKTTTTTTATTTKARARTITTSQREEKITSRCSSGSTSSAGKTLGENKTSHSWYEPDKVDTRCRYCCMQFLKMKQQKIVKRSQYCPIDLFSGIYEKMLFALQALLQCPQNNLRIFRNGNLLFDDQISRTSKIEDLLSSDKLQLIKHLLVTCLLREYDNKGEANNKQRGQETQQQLLSSTPSTADYGMLGVRGGDEGDGNRSGSRRTGVAAGQPQSSVTSCKKQTLSTMPKITATTVTVLTETEVTKVKSTLTPAEHISPMASTLTSTSDYSTRCLEQISKTEVTWLPKNCVLQKILHLQSLAKINLQFMLDHEYADKREKTYDIFCKLLEKFAKTHNELTLGQLSPEEQYILAATALDCSIMITFCEIENVRADENKKAKRSLNDNPFVVSLSGRKFLTKVTLLDLDPKPDCHFYKYVLQAQQIVDAMRQL